MDIVISNRPSRTWGRRVGTGALCTLLTVVLTALAVPRADAATTYWTVYNHCSTGGFTGTVRIKDYTTSSTAMRLTEVAYKIDKGTNSGGNKGHLDFIDLVTHDGGGAPYYPDRREWRFDNTVADGQYHVMTTVPDYNRVRGSEVTMWFRFDKSNAIDPWCGVSWNL